jgi:hypothetical protein
VVGGPAEAAPLARKYLRPNRVWTRIGWGPVWDHTSCAMVHDLCVCARHACPCRARSLPLACGNVLPLFTGGQVVAGSNPVSPTSITAVQSMFPALAKQTCVIGVRSEPLPPRWLLHTRMESPMNTTPTTDQARLALALARLKMCSRDLTAARQGALDAAAGLSGARHARADQLPRKSLRGIIQAAINSTFPTRTSCGRCSWLATLNGCPPSTVHIERAARRASGSALTFGAETETFRRAGRA